MKFLLNNNKREEIKLKNKDRVIFNILYQICHRMSKIIQFTGL